MKKLKNIFLILIVSFCLVSFSGCSFNFFNFVETDQTRDNTKYVEVVSNKIVSSNSSTQEEYVATSDILSENATLSNLINTKEIIRSFNVYIETKLYDRGYFNQRIYETTNLGSGSIIYINPTSRLTYVLTNYHVVTKFNTNTGLNYQYCTYTVETISGTTHTATLVNYSETDDMAILSFYSSASENLGIANLSARSDGKVYKNEFLLAVGNPSGVRNIVTFGKFLGTSTISNVKYQVIHHNVLINPGNSGGALTDINGNIVGINTWGTDGDDEDNYSIPLKKVLLFITETQQNISNFPTIVA